jgi:hypothetical protein
MSTEQLLGGASTNALLLTLRGDRIDSWLLLLANGKQLRRVHTVELACNMKLKCLSGVK